MLARCAYSKVSVRLEQGVLCEILWYPGPLTASERQVLSENILKIQQRPEARSVKNTQPRASSAPCLRARWCRLCLHRRPPSGVGMQHAGYQHVGCNACFSLRVVHRQAASADRAALAADRYENENVINNHQRARYTHHCLPGYKTVTYQIVSVHFLIALLPRNILRDAC